MSGGAATVEEYAHREALASTAWLAAHLDDPSVCVVDARYEVRPASGGSFEAVSGRRAYDEGHIPGAVFLDIASDLASPEEEVNILSSADFEALMGRLGIGNDTTVVAYDDLGGVWAARVWWALRYYGHDDAKLLNGGLTRWKAEGRPRETRSPVPATTAFRAHVRPQLRATKEQVLEAIERSDVRIVDALPEPFFIGEARLYPNHRQGHIPMARNLPAPANLDPETHTLLPAPELAHLWRGVDVEQERRVITYCGAGVFASFALFALHLLGHENVSLYDASWQEWGADPELPVATGPGRDRPRGQS